MNWSEIEAFRKMLAQLDGLHQEMAVAAKKGADKPVSAFKIRLVNSVLGQARAALGASAPDLGFEVFEVDDLPSASDVSLIVTQYVECAEKVRCENIGRLHNGVWYWRAGTELTAIATNAPRGAR